MTSADREQLIVWLESRYKDTTMPGAKRMFKLALDAVREQPANEPLTLEQLREMDGEPVWCVDCFGNQCWALVNVADDDCIDKETGAWNMGLYGVSDKPVDLTGWLAYRRNPERSEG